MATADHGQPDRSEAIRVMAEALVDAFGDRAVQVAQRQLEMAVDSDSIATWQALVGAVHRE